MSYTTRRYIVNNITLPLNASHKEAFTIAAKKLRSLGISADPESMMIYRRSVDARKRGEIKFVFSVLANTSDRTMRQLAPSSGVVAYDYADPKISIGHTKLDSNVVVVGSGPCGLFAALLLAENGYHPILIERGGSVDERNAAIDRFKETRVLDENTNVQFGAGGAGTFSDVKLVTRINDSTSTYVLKRFVEFGAPE